MKITVERSLLNEAVSRLQKVVGNKTSMPVLEGILISAESEKVTLIAYNLEMGMKKEITAVCEEEGDIVINARILSDIVRKLKGDYIVIETNERLTCTIRCLDTVFEIMGMAASDYPEMPIVSEGEKISLSASSFSDMVRGTLFAVSQIEGTKPILTGLNITAKNGILQFVGIDGFRLAIRREKCENINDMDFVVSGRAVNEIVKLIDEKCENIDIVVGKRLISFNIDGYLFISRLLDGDFVNFEKIIPQESKEKTVISRGDFIDAIERVSLLINDSFTTPVRCGFESDFVNISCATAAGRVNEKYELKLEGEPFEIGLNSRYLLEAMRACDAEKVTVKFNGPNTGVLILPENENDIDFTYIIMPMRIK